MAPRQLCTYLDLQYLDKGIAMFESLSQHLEDFHLRVVCFDDLSHAVLSELGDPRLEPVHVSELERADPELVQTRIQRSQLEYMWTATPCVVRYFRERDSLEEITYLDADIRFYADPTPAFEALADGSVLLTPASSAPQHYSKGLVERTGLFIVQFMSFRSDQNGSAALEWWRERCLEWCYARYEDGKMGDQLYLDDWPARFEGVRLLGHPGVLGPWCIESRDVARGPAGITVDGEPLLFFHFMGLQTYREGRDRLAAGRFRITREQREWIYEPYLRDLEAVRERIAESQPAYPARLPLREPPAKRARALVSTAIGHAVRARTRLAPHWNIGPYLPGGYVPTGYEPAR